MLCTIVRASVRASEQFPWYRRYLLMDFRLTFVIGTSSDKDELIRFWGQKVKDQGHIIAAEASSTLPSSEAFLSIQFLFVNINFHESSSSIAQFQRLWTWSRDSVMRHVDYFCFSRYSKVTRRMTEPTVSYAESVPRYTIKISSKIDRI